MVVTGCARARSRGSSHHSIASTETTRRLISFRPIFNRRNLTKGQQMMAMAMIYPESKPGRPEKGKSLSISPYLLESYGVRTWIDPFERRDGINVPHVQLARAADC